MAGTSPDTAEPTPATGGFQAYDDPVFGPQTYRAPRPRMRQEGEVFYLRQDFDLPEFPDSVIDYLLASARACPDRLALAERGPDGWAGPTFAQLKDDCAAIAQALLDRGLGQGDCVAILSRNSIAHAEMTFGAMMAGLMVAPISPSYARFSEAFERLESTFAQSGAQVFFVDDAQALAEPLGRLDLTGCQVVSENPRPGDIAFADLLATPVTDAVARAHAAVTPDTVGKLLFTSGSTGSPKGVINTHRMMCANQAMAEAVAMPVDKPYRRKLCWLPWHHTFGGNHILNDTLRAGATLYIDSGRPVAGPDFQRTLEAIREVRPTNYSNVPLAYGMMVDEMEQDPSLAEAFFSELAYLHSGGAAFPGETYDRLQKLAVAHRGYRIPLTGGFAMTELAPSAMTIHWPLDAVGRVGMPMPGVEIKLLPLGDDRYELRIKGPNVFPGYINQPELNRTIFDDEGFFRTGDAMRFDDVRNIAGNLRYAGRVSEDFKLDSGTFVQVGAIRTGINLECGGLVRDAVIAGEGHAHIAALVWLTDAARARALRVQDGLIEPAPQDLAVLQAALARWNGANHGSSRQIRVIGVLADPPDMAANEINDKGYINQRQVLRQRAGIVSGVYDGALADLLVTDKEV